MEDAWLGVDTSKFVEGMDYSDHPLFSREKFLEDNVGAREILCMRTPEYIGYTAHQLLGIRLAPFQMAVLHELWTHSFPMFIGCRGAGKCTQGAYIQTNNGFCPIDDLVPPHAQDEERVYFNNLQMFGENGYHDVEYAWRNSNQKTLDLKTNYGYELNGLPEHKMRVLCGGEVVWKFMSEIRSGDYVPIDRSTEWFPNTNNLTEDEGYFMGAIIGDGCTCPSTPKQIGFTTEDHDHFVAELSPVVQKYNASLSKIKCKYQYSITKNKELRKKMFGEWDMKIATAGCKEVPKSIFSAPKNTVAAFISGLFDTDGCCNAKAPTVELSSKSEKLVKQVQFLLLKFGISCRTKTRLNKKYNTNYYYLTIGGSSLRIFRTEIGFRLDRKQKIIDKHCSVTSNDNIDVIPKDLVNNSILRLKKYAKENGGLNWRTTPKNKQRWFTTYVLNSYDMSYDKLQKILSLANYPENSDWQFLNDICNKKYFYDKVQSVRKGKISPTYDMHLEEDHTYISNGFISHNSFVLGLYALLACVLNPEYKVIIAGASFRQSKMIFEYVEKLWNQSPMIRSMCNKRSGASKDVDRWTFRINDSTITAIPIGTGEKIRGLRSNCIIVDEFAAHNPILLEEVIFGFGAVASNPTDKVIAEARKKKALSMGIDLLETEDVNPFSKNKAIIAGTADYYFNHFYDYFNRYKDIINSKGDKKKLEEIFGGEVPEAFDWRQYSVLRIPYSILPKGFMEDETVARAKAQMTESLYRKEYEAIFVEDSDGFFKRSLIEACVASDKNVADYNWVDFCPAPFEPVTRGNSKATYVIGCDPAAKSDNFAVTLLEVYPDHNRVIYCWTTNEEDFIKRKKAGFIEIDDYYSYCVRHIRHLTKVFPGVVSLGIDTQGGGYALMERFRDTSLLEPGEEAFYETIDFDKSKDSDLMPGRHIIHPIQFASAAWMGEANWGLRGDLEGRTLLFPNYDSLTAEISIAEDKMRVQQFKQKYGSAKELVLFDTLEDCAENIEELKDELTNITYSRTPAGREKWDVPEIKVEKNKKESGKKDRYSALLIANHLARAARVNIDPEFSYDCAGGFVNDVGTQASSTNDKIMYSGPEWYKPTW